MTEATKQALIRVHQILHEAGWDEISVEDGDCEATESEPVVEGEEDS